MNSSGIVRGSSDRPASMGSNPTTFCTQSAPNTVSPISASSTQNGTSPSAVKLCERKSRSWMSGCSMRSSASTNTTSRTTPAARQPIVLAEPHPHSWLCMSASTSAVRPGTIVNRPTQSMRAPWMGVPRGNRDVGQDQHHDADRHVDPEHRAPADVLGDPAEQRAYGEEDHRDPGVEPHRASTLLGLERVDDDGP